MLKSISFVLVISILQSSQICVAQDEPIELSDSAERRDAGSTKSTAPCECQVGVDCFGTKLKCEANKRGANIVEIPCTDKCKLDLKYSNGKYYPKEFKKAYLDEKCVPNFQKLTEILQSDEKYQNCKLVVFDSLRNCAVQTQLILNLNPNLVHKGKCADETSSEVSFHLLGQALDVGLECNNISAEESACGKHDDLRTAPFDYDFSKFAQKDEKKSNRKAQSKTSCTSHRLKLRKLMNRAGFGALNKEWWHFQCPKSKNEKKDAKK